MNTSKKGYTKEKLARDELTKEGWKIVFQSIRTRWATYDYADLFDIVAYRGKDRKFISCKHFGKSNNYLQHQEDIRQFRKEHQLDNEEYELWLWTSPRWIGRGDNKQFINGHFKKIKILDVGTMGID